MRPAVYVNAFKQDSQMDLSLVFGAENWHQQLKSFMQEDQWVLKELTTIKYIVVYGNGTDSLINRRFI